VAADSAGQVQSRTNQPLVDSVEAAAPSADPYYELFDQLRKMEQRLDRLTKENQDLARKNKSLEEQFDELSRKITHSGSAPSGSTENAVFRSFSGASASPDEVIRPISFEDSEAAPGPEFLTASYGSDIDCVDVDSVHAACGGSNCGCNPKTTGGDQEVGNRHRGKVSLKTYYDFDNGGFKLSTQDDEYSLGIRAMEQLDGRVYSEPAPGYASSGIYNPRTRIGALPSVRCDTRVG